MDLLALIPLALLILGVFSVVISLRGINEASGRTARALEELVARERRRDGKGEPSPQPRPER